MIEMGKRFAINDKKAQQAFNEVSAAMHAEKSAEN